MDLEWKLIPVQMLRLNPSNPRTISKKSFNKLIKSIQEFPEMLELRPVVADFSGEIQGGAQRYRAVCHLGWKEVPCILADMTDEQVRQFIVKDNTHQGAFDCDILAGNYELEELRDWGMSFPDMDFNIRETKPRKLRIVSCPHCKEDFEM